MNQGLATSNSTPHHRHHHHTKRGHRTKCAPNETRRTKCSPNWAPKRIVHQNRSRAEMEKSLKCALEEDGTGVFYCNRNRFRLLLHPSPSLKNYPTKRKRERMSIRPWFWSRQLSKRPNSLLFHNAHSPSSLCPSSARESDANNAQISPRVRQ